MVCYVSRTCCLRELQRVVVEFAWLLEIPMDGLEKAWADLSRRLWLGMYLFSVWPDGFARILTEWTLHQAGPTHR